MTLRAWIKDTVEIAKQYPKFFGGVLVSTAIIFIVRFFADFWVPRSDALRVFKSPETKSFPGETDKEWLYATIDGWFPEGTAEPDSEKVAERQIVLQAIYGDRRHRNAVFLLRAEGATDERVTLEIGKVVEGWTVKDMQRKRVVLVKGVQTRELVLFPTKAGL